MVTTRSIPLARPHIGERERELVMDVLRSDTLACGEMVPAFERGFAERVGTRFAVACSSGTAGLHVALHRLCLEPGDEVITSSFSFIASANVILHERATPVFAEIDERTLNVDPAAVEAAITTRTRAIVPIHIFGYPCDIEKISRIAADHGVAVVEEACEALGCPVGTHGHPAVYGFYPNKQLTTGEGGMITTDDDDTARAFRSLVNQGRSDNGDWLVHQRIGFNYRMDEMSAAIGIAQLEKLETLLEARRRVAERYDELLSGIDGIELPYRGPEARSWFIYYVRIAAGLDRDAVAAGLAARGVATRPYLPAIHLQPPYRERFGYEDGMLPVTERVSSSTLALPFYVQLEDDDVAHVASSLRGVLQEL